MIRVLVLACLVVAIGVPPAAADTHPRNRYAVEATLNVYRANPPNEIRADVRRALDLADVVRVQEAYRPRAHAAVLAVLDHRPNWRSATNGSELVTLWDRREFRRDGRARTILVNRYRPSTDGHGNPPRWLQWVALEHRRTGQIVTIANVHPDPGACRDNARAREAIRVARVSDHWRDVAAWTREQRARYPRRTILLGGDFNCRNRAFGRPWFPGVILRPYYRHDRAPRTVDHLWTSRTPGHPTGVNRWHVEAFSDHDLHLRRIRFHG